MRPNFFQFLLLWAELKKLYRNQTAGKGKESGFNPGGGHNLDNALVLGCQIGFNF